MENLEIVLKGEYDNSYEIVFTQKVGELLSEFLLKNNKKKILIITDSNIYPIHYKNLINSIKDEIKVFYYVLESGEKNKNIESVLNINKKLIEEKFNRGDILVALGGGVVGDIVGFSASIFKRGIDFIQIPTTLLSMLDSSVGGKTGVDFEGVKNIIGTFNQPKLVLIDSKFLYTLPKKEILSGYFEGLKHSLITSEEYFEEFKLYGNKILNLGNEFSSFELIKILKKNISVKANIVMKDEKENFMRKFLNFGHTFGHALETVTNFELTHGVGVAYGIIFANILSNKLGFLTDKYSKEINSFILSILNKYNTLDLSQFQLSFESIYSNMLYDKKNNDKDITFVLIKKPGELYVENIGENRKKILKNTFEEFLGII